MHFNNTYFSNNEKLVANAWLLQMGIMPERHGFGYAYDSEIDLNVSAISTNTSIKIGSK